jgi:hypothetical protein
VWPVYFSGHIPGTKTGCPIPAQQEPVSYEETGSCLKTAACASPPCCAIMAYIVFSFFFIGNGIAGSNQPSHRWKNDENIPE